MRRYVGQLSLEFISKVSQLSQAANTNPTRKKMNQLLQLLGRYLFPSECQMRRTGSILPRSLIRILSIRRGRETVLQREADSVNTEEAQKKRELEAEERKQETINMIADSIKRELAESESCHSCHICICISHVNLEAEETQELIPDVDDTDGIDPTAEFEAWRLRELGRIKKEKEAELEREEEKREIARRRAMPEEQRLKEDLEHAQKSRDEKPKGQQVFLQKYWHKGAFHQVRHVPIPSLSA